MNTPIPRRHWIITYVKDVFDWIVFVFQETPPSYWHRIYRAHAIAMSLKRASEYIAKHEH